MKVFLQRLLKFLAYTAAAVVILLAIGVGLFRLFLPRLPEYQEEIKLWASTAIGMRVEFSSMDARWGLQGPELAFHDTELLQAGGPLRIVAADEVRVGIALNRLLFDNALVVDRVVIRDTSVEIRQLDSGEFLVQGQRPGRRTDRLGARRTRGQHPGCKRADQHHPARRHAPPGAPRECADTPAAHLEPTSPPHGITSFPVAATPSRPDRTR